MNVLVKPVDWVNGAMKLIWQEHIYKNQMSIEKPLKYF